MKLNEILHEALSADSNEHKVLHDFYSKSLQEILEAKLMIETKEKEIRAKLAMYSQEVINYPSAGVTPLENSNIEGRKFPYTGSWAERIDFVLDGKVLTGRQISDAIEVYQPELKGKANSSVYPTLTDNIKVNKRYIKRMDNNQKKNVFSLK
jgi:hypothetical protein